MLREQVLLFDEGAREEFMSEIEFLRTLRHKNIVLFHGAGTRNGLPFLVTELMVPSPLILSTCRLYCRHHTASVTSLLYVDHQARGSLRVILADMTLELDAARRLDFARDTAKGMSFLHSQRKRSLALYIPAISMPSNPQYIFFNF